ncbi:MAG: histidine kinase dimerization/phospho-acceptor domain-containing protein, partial [Syntrophales bacterium]|nr:histidine kinase dimerization/phospho-acceptor domain-containing protein [Syntrophales bacterium]
MVFQKETQLYKTFILSISLLIGLLLSAVFFGMTLRTRSLIMDELVSCARAYFETIVATRLWNSQYDGVYVEKKGGVQSNLYIQNPDIETKDGRVFTVRNHAIMTREISDIIGKNRDFRFHITGGGSLINPNNKPDGFEQRALDLFKQGQKEIHEINSANNHVNFRYMGALVTTRECVNCHAGHGYKEGNVGGGISVTFNIDDVDKKLKVNTWFIIIFGISTIVLLVALLWFLTRRLMIKVIDARKEIEQKNIKLEELDQLKNKFLGIAVHDMRNPLSSIRGFSEIILDETTGPLSEEQKEFIGIIYSASDGMLQLVNDLLDISAIESGKLDLN